MLQFSADIRFFVKALIETNVNISNEIYEDGLKSSEPDHDPVILKC